MKLARDSQSSSAQNGVMDLQIILEIEDKNSIIPFNPFFWIAPPVPQCARMNSPSIY